MSAVAPNGLSGAVATAAAQNSPPVGQIIWITGASSGIGEALARCYVAAGAAVILTARRADRLAAISETLPDSSRVLLLPGDLEDSSIHAPLAAAALAWHGHVDVVIHSAGVSQRASVADTNMATVRRLLEINFFAVVGITRELLPSMLSRGRGTIVVIGSVVSYVATPQRSAYAAAKHAVRAWADALRGEVGPNGIQVTTVIAGYIATGISAAALRGDGSQKGEIDQNDARGAPVERTADQIYAGIKAGRREVMVGGKELWSIPLIRYFPGLVARLLPRFVPR